MARARKKDDDLFRAEHEANLRKAQPLAARLRPRTLDEFVGQQQFLGEGKLLRRLLQADRLGSAVFYGPPGTGKTALAQVIANQTQGRFRPLNAVASGTKDVREILDEARTELEETGRRTILFVDELHRFNKAQQDVLLPDVEEGRIILIGATTQNPFFAVNAPLLSRSQIFTFEPLSRDDILMLLRRAIADKERGLGTVDVRATEDALAFLAEMSDGDARRALNALEVGVLSAGPPPAKKGTVPLPQGDSPLFRGPVEFTLDAARESIQRKSLLFDPTGDTHYDMASAFIKSLRGSDPDAGLYWLARMLESGEDPRFIARRLVILASEDVGNADPQALVLASAAAQAVEFVGLPECQLNLAQAVTYLALAPKSNAATVALGRAQEDVRSGRTLEVPEHLRSGAYQGAKAFGHGEGYEYSHDQPDAWSDQPYLPEDRRYYEPVGRGFEQEMARRLDELRRRRAAAHSSQEGAR